MADMALGAAAHDGGDSKACHYACCAATQGCRLLAMCTMPAAERLNGAATMMTTIGAQRMTQLCSNHDDNDWCLLMTCEYNCWLSE